MLVVFIDSILWLLKTNLNKIIDLDSSKPEMYNYFIELIEDIESISLTISLSHSIDMTNSLVILSNLEEMSLLDH